MTTLSDVDVALKRFAITTSKGDFKILCNEVTNLRNEIFANLQELEPLKTHDVCCVDCLEKGQYMTYKEILEEKEIVGRGKSEIQTKA